MFSSWKDPECKNLWSKWTEADNNLSGLKWYGEVITAESIIFIHLPQTVTHVKETGRVWVNNGPEFEVQTCSPSACSVLGAQEDVWLSACRGRDLRPHQTGLLIETDPVQDRQRTADRVHCSVTASYWPAFILCEHPTTTTHTSIPTHRAHNNTLTHLSLQLMERGRRCFNLSFLSRYQCPISIHPWVHRFPLPVLSNLSQLLWLWLPPKSQSALSLPGHPA